MSKTGTDDCVSGKCGGKGQRDESSDDGRLSNIGTVANTGRKRKTSSGDASIAHAPPRLVKLARGGEEEEMTLPSSNWPLPSSDTSEWQRERFISKHRIGLLPTAANREDSAGFPPVRSFISSEDIVKPHVMAGYQAHFRNPGNEEDRTFEPHETRYPVVQLLYPSAEVSERYILLAPKNKEGYNPIRDLELTIYTMADSYCTGRHRALLGIIPNIEDDTGKDIHERKGVTPGILEDLRSAVRRRDGPTFTKMVMKINKAFQDCKAEGGWQLRPNDGRGDLLPSRVVMRILDETYQRCVIPQVKRLLQYPAFSNEVYGEILPSLVDSIIRTAHLTSDCLFMDLGSGVGHVCVQTSLRTGCRSFGIEVRSDPADIAKTVESQTGIRARMWGVCMGNVELTCGDMLTCMRVDELLRIADVVLVNNKVFSEQLNMSIREKLWLLKEGAILVSTAPLVAAEYDRERSMDALRRRFMVTKLPYPGGSLSWTDNEGYYWSHKVYIEGSDLEIPRGSRTSGAWRNGYSAKPDMNY
ncbi:hypothetical protein NMY22_g9253 [Coprinellus aureogranulatus]|nr:hypothetical protein NMY22_g9253 [Coprinellus aureogranulatus]